MAEEQANDPVSSFCDKLRTKRGVEQKTAVLRNQRVDYFRGKDLARYLRSNPEELSNVLTRGNSGRIESQIKEFGQLLLRRQLVFRCDRYYKKPKPGKARLVKYPKKLEEVREQTWDENSFYAWRYELPISVWTYVFSVLLVVGILLACFFPLAPYWAKVAVLYISLALLGVITAIFVVRTVLFFALWIPLGWEFWLFPNITKDTVSVVEAFTPFYSFEKHSSGWGQVAARVGSVFVGIGLVYILLIYRPDNKAILSGATSAHDALFDLLDLKNPRVALGGSGGRSMPRRGSGMGMDINMMGEEPEQKEAEPKVNPVDAADDAATQFNEESADTEQQATGDQEKKTEL